MRCIVRGYKTEQKDKTAEADGNIRLSIPIHDQMIPLKVI